MTQIVKMTRPELRDAYATYRRSEHWKNLKAEKLARHSQCQICKERPATEPHHLRYKNLYDVMIDDLLSVCHGCHFRIHTNPYHPLNPVNLRRLEQSGLKPLRPLKPWKQITCNRHRGYRNHNDIIDDIRDQLIQDAQGSA
jgi:hypothetical protein